ncbi:solute carrier family 35 member G1 [Gadus chalcogrammus]|uniref:solute carrier family 35 member G1 n=1 Tax=Gadus chalcogrammus TaxID=1042646 RepID=UPI0024C4E0B6|nr:solute carrier family 35 member G1 [Gadus chalcogrammus]
MLLISTSHQGYTLTRDEYFPRKPESVSPRHAAVQPLLLTMDDRTERGDQMIGEDRALRVVPRRAEADVTVVFQKAGHDCEDEDEDVECAAERISLQTNSHIRPHDDDGEASFDYADDEEKAKTRGRKKKRRLCPPVMCFTNRHGEDQKHPGDSFGNGVVAAVVEEEAEGKKKRCPGLGLFYGLLSTMFFSIIALLVKTIKDVHSIEISAFRCFFQMLFVLPLLIYHKTGFLGPRDKRIFLVLRGFLGSNAMILLFYAVQQMPLADATVIMFSNPVFTALLAWIFLKEKCTLWDCFFTVFTLTGVILIARPPFLFGERPPGIEGNYTNHIKGTIAAFAGAMGAACTMVVLRKMGKSVHYYLSVWYYAVIGLAECLIVLAVLGQWALPPCGRDRWILMLIAVLGIAGQAFLTKALQIEKAGPVALMRTLDVLLAFVFQFVFFGRAPSWWSLGGALCVVLSTVGVVLRKWYRNTHK